MTEDIKPSILKEVDDTVVMGLKYLRGNYDEEMPPGMTAEKILYLAYACFNHARIKLEMVLGDEEE